MIRRRNLINKITVKALTVPFILISTICAGFAIARNNTDGIEDVSFKVFAEKDSYLKGEPVKLRVELINAGSNDIKFIPPHESRLWISKDKKTYKFHDGDPKDDSVYSFFSLKTKQSWEMNLLPFLWNGKRSYSHLVGDTKSIEEADEKTRITSEYIFQDAGTYYAMVKIKISDEKNQKVNRIEAEPVAIIIKEPLGDDLKIWEQIKGNIDFAYLMQYGRFSSSIDEKRKTSLLQKAEQITSEYPNSIYSNYLKIGVDRIRDSENKEQK